MADRGTTAVGADGRLRREVGGDDLEELVRHVGGRHGGVSFGSEGNHAMAQTPCHLVLSELLVLLR
jgi:hypothetical protein